MKEIIWQEFILKYFFSTSILVGAKIDDIPEETIKEPLKAYVNIDPSGEKGVFVVPTNLVPKKILKTMTKKSIRLMQHYIVC